MTDEEFCKAFHRKVADVWDEMIADEPRNARFVIAVSTPEDFLWAGGDKRGVSAENVARDFYAASVASGQVYLEELIGKPDNTEVH